MNDQSSGHVTWQRVAAAALIVLAGVAGWQFEQEAARQDQSTYAIQKLTVQVAQLTEQVREQNVLLTSIPDTRHRVTVLEVEVGRLEDDVAQLQNKHNKR